MHPQIPRLQKTQEVKVLCDSSTFFQRITDTLPKPQPSTTKKNVSSDFRNQMNRKHIPIEISTLQKEPLKQEND